MVICSVCNGEGRVRTEYARPYDVHERCVACYGRGEFHEEEPLEFFPCTCGCGQDLLAEELVEHEGRRRFATGNPIQKDGWKKIYLR